MGNNASAESKNNTIDSAIKECDEIIQIHQISGKNIGFYGMFLATLLLFCGMSLWFLSRPIDLRPLEFVSSPKTNAITSSLNNTNASNATNSTVAIKTSNDVQAKTTEYLDFLSKAFYLAFAGFIVVFSILVALYRFHMLEVSRNQQAKLGFMRIRIAGNNGDDEYNTEVRKSLTKDAFHFHHGKEKAKEKEIENPVPGHPTLELTTAIMNKILEKIDIEVKNK